MKLLHLRRFTEALVAGLLAGAVLLVLAPVFLGWRPYTVLTGSMRPGIQPGDVVMDRPVKITDAHVGDVVTFSDPTRRGVLVTHRIRSIDHGPDLTKVETRGDANTSSERWTIATKDRVGEVVYVLPKIGHVATIIRNPLGIVVLVVLPILLIGGGVLRKIWQDDDDDEQAGPDPEGDDPIDAASPVDEVPDPGADARPIAPSPPTLPEPAPAPPATPRWAATPRDAEGDGPPGDAHPAHAPVGSPDAAAIGADR